MIEILILYILYYGKNTLYGVRKTIKDKFLHLNSATFGSIHPAVNRLVSKGFVQDKRTMTEGGRKKYIYSITKTGKEHLILTLSSEFSYKANNQEKQIASKLACSDVLDVQLRQELYTKAVRYYEYKIALYKKMLKNEEYSGFQEAQLNVFIKNCEDDIKLLRNFID